MAHDPSLIYRICELLRKDYDPTIYEFVIEKAIPGTRMHPDVVVRDISTKKIECAVEIGYTRPEKLTAYRKQLKIPDVRWYDRQGNLHGDVKEKIVKVSLELVPRFATYVYVIEAPGIFLPGDDVRAFVSCINKKCLKHESLLIDCDDEYYDDCASCDCEDHCKQATLQNYEDVTTTIVTDRAKAFFPSSCCCGTNWLADTNFEAEDLMEDLEIMQPQQFAKKYGARTHMSWIKAQELVEKRHSIKLDYQDGTLFKNVNLYDVRRSTATVVAANRATEDA